VVIAAAFLVTLVTAIVPNPSTVAASHLALRRGTRAAAAFLGAVLLLDTMVFTLFACSLEPLLHGLGLTRYLLPVAAIGLSGLGLVMVTGACRATSRPAPAAADRESRLLTMVGPFAAGLVLPAVNPGFWIWWSTVGAAFIYSARDWGRSGVVLVFAAYLSGVVAWYLPLLLALRRGGHVVPPHVQRRFLVALGVVMILFGAHLAVQSLTPSAHAVEEQAQQP
jgi:threonine/homoserine/homoserine lactone efflux protein